MKRKEEGIKLKILNVVDKLIEVKMQIDENDEKFPEILAEKDKVFAKERKAEEIAEKEVNLLEQLCEEKRGSIQSLQEEN